MDRTERRLLARQNGTGFAARAVEHNPRTVVWPEEPFDTILVSEQIRRNVSPRRPAYRARTEPWAKRYIATLSAEIDQVIARRIRSLRVSTGMRQVDLAAAIGVTPATLCRIERAKRPITFAEIVRLATQLAVPIESFIEPPADHVPTEWVRAPRRPEPPTWKEQRAYERAIFDEELPDLIQATGKTRDELEAEWFPEAEEKERFRALLGLPSGQGG